MNKTAEQFIQDHQEWLKLWKNNEATLEERPIGKKYDLNNAKLQDANLQGADLSYAKLYYAKLEGADLTNANLEDAKLFGANLSNTDLIGAKLNNADLYGAKIDIKCKDYIKTQNVRYFRDIKWIESEDKNEINFEETIKNNDSKIVYSIPQDKLEHLIQILSRLWGLEQVLISNGISEIEARETITILCEKRLKDIK